MVIHKKDAETAGFPQRKTLNIAQNVETGFDSKIGFRFRGRTSFGRERS